MRSLDKFLATTVLAAGMTLVAGGAVFAQTASAPGTPSTQQMIDQLKPHTRGLIIGGSSAPPAATPPAMSATTATPPDYGGCADHQRYAFGRTGRYDDDDPAAGLDGCETVAQPARAVRLQFGRFDA